MNRLMDKPTIIFCWVSTGLILGAVSMILGYLLVRGLSTVNLGLIFGETAPLDALLLKKPVFDSLFPAILGTLMLVVLSVSMAIPIGLSTGIYLAEYACSNTKRIFNLFFDVLAGIPSIVVGLFGFSLSVFLHKHYSRNIQPCLLISGLSLAFLVLPYIIRTTQVTLEGLPFTTRITGLALGATKLQNIFFILIPRSHQGIVSGVILAIGRCAEDTAVIMLTGVVAMAGIPKSLLAKYEALPFYIYYISSQYRDTRELMMGYGASIILLILCIILFSIAFILKRRLAYMALYRA